MKLLDWIKKVAGVRSVDDSIARIDEDEEIDSFNPFPDPVRVEITDIIDLHTIPPPDVKRVVEEYLVEAHAKGFRSVRIIHGKGIGVQRAIVRAVLERTSLVADWTDAPPDAGGLGATIVHLSQSRTQESSDHADGTDQSLI